MCANQVEIVNHLVLSDSLMNQPYFSLVMHVHRQINPKAAPSHASVYRQHSAHIIILSLHANVM